MAAMAEVLPVPEIRALIAGLLEGWAGIEGESILVSKGWTIARFATIWSMAAHAHQEARAVLRLLDDNTPDVVIAPNVRGCLEAGVTAQWLLRVDDATESLLNEGSRQRRNNFDRMGQVPLASFKVPQAVLDALDVDDLETASGRSGKYFLERCLDLTPGGLELYTYYSFLSQWSHASAEVTEFYIEVDDDAPEAPMLKLTPDAGTDYLPFMLWIVGCGLVWAGRAVDLRHVGRPRRSALQKASRDLTTALDLKASDRVWLRDHPDRRQP